MVLQLGILHITCRIQVRLLPVSRLGSFLDSASWESGGDSVVVKQFTDIPINRGLFKEKTETGSNFTVPVFLQYVISLMHQKVRVWFSQKILTEITYRKISIRESWLSFSFSRHWRCYMSVLLFTPGHPLTPQATLWHPRMHSIWLESRLFCCIWQIITKL